MGVIKDTEQIIVDPTRLIGITNEQNFVRKGKVRKGKFAGRRFNYKSMPFSKSGLRDLIKQKKNHESLIFKNTEFNVGLVKSALTIMRGFQQQTRLGDCEFEVYFVKRVKYSYPLVFRDDNLVVMIPPIPNEEEEKM